MDFGNFISPIRDKVHVLFLLGVKFDFEFLNELFAVSKKIFLFVSFLFNFSGRFQFSNVINGIFLSILSKAFLNKTFSDKRQIKSVLSRIIELFLQKRTVRPFAYLQDFFGIST